MNNEMSEPIEDDDIDIDNGDCERYGTSSGRSEVKDGEDSEAPDDDADEGEEQRSHTIGELLAMIRFVYYQL